MKVKVGDTIGGRYLLRREASRGTLGAVFEATHQLTGHRVALKVLRARWVNVDSMRARRFREARALGTMTHPGIVAVYDAGDDPVAGPFLALEMLEGRSLAGILAARAALPVADAIALALRLAQALVSMHERGFVHRGVRPENVFVVRAADGMPQRSELIDLGAAVAIEGSPDLGIESQAEREATFSPFYEAPERLRGADGRSPRADLYGWAAVVHSAIEGEPAAALSQRGPGSGSRGRLSRAHVPPALTELLVACLQPNERDRPADGKVVLHILEALATEHRVLHILDSQEKDDARGAAPSEMPRRRQYPRAPYVTPVRVLAGDRTYDGRSEDLSEGGLLVVLPVGLRVKDTVRVRFALPVTGTIISLDATAAWIKPAREGFDAVGFTLTGWPDGARLEAQQYATLMGEAAPAA